MSSPSRGLAVRCQFFVVMVPVITVASGCASVPTTVRGTMPGQERGVVFVADGSGDSRAVSDGLTGPLQPACLRVQRVPWSHGTGRVLADVYDAGHQKCEGQKLAQEVLAYRQANPGNHIYLVGYSSGTGVVLDAAQSLPPCSVDRIVLLAPVVTARRDLRPSLRAACQGIDSFRSEWDGVCLMLSTGTADGFAEPVAGRSGFTPINQCAGDQELYAKLHEHCWSGSRNWSGHDGGHYGYSRASFLRDQVAPLLCTP
jgi:pimeloyl-ACP methyl ester carboxylesterase